MYSQVPKYSVGQANAASCDCVITFSSLLSAGIIPKLFLQELNFDPKELPNLTFKYRATITGAWTTFQSEVVAALSQFHILGPDFLDK